MSFPSGHPANPSPAEGFAYRGSKPKTSIPGMSVNGDTNGAANADSENMSSSEGGGTGSKIGVLRLAALLFFSVGGGPLGTEGLVKAVGPFYSILGLCIWPIIWCCPVAFMTAELATAIPKDGGYVWWVDAAFGRFLGFMAGWMSWSAGVVDNAIYPGMFLSFMQKSFNYNLSTLGKQMTLVAFNVVLTATNLVGIGVAGSASVVFLVVVLSPVAILVLVAMPHMSLGGLLATTPTLNFFEWVNIIVWNTNRWEACSTYATQVTDPTRTFPRAIWLVGFAVIVPYLLCIIAACTLDHDYASYQNGTYNTIAMQHGGLLLGLLFTVGTVCAAAGMYVSDMTTYSYLLSGMAEEGLVPSILGAKLPQRGTPFVAIVLQFLVVLWLCNMEFHDILMVDNMLYCTVLVLELAAMVQLRRSHPTMARPFKVPLSTLGVFVMCCSPAVFCFFLLFSSSAKVLAIEASIIAAGVGIWYLTEHLKDRSNGKMNLGSTSSTPFITAAVQGYSAL